MKRATHVGQISFCKILKVSKHILYIVNYWNINKLENNFKQ